MRDIYGNQLNEAPKKNKERDFNESHHSKDLGWVYVSKTPSGKRKAVRTYSSLIAITEDPTYYYFTPNTFYRNDSNCQRNLRWINTVSADIDTAEGVTANLVDVLEAIQQAGLEEPSLVVRTRSGGLHVHWILDQPKRHTSRVVTHYKRIGKLICEELNEFLDMDVMYADTQAASPERLFRLPTDECIEYRSSSRVTFDDLCTWYSIEVDRRQTQSKTGFVQYGQSLMGTPAIKKLLEGAEKGQRDQTCYTLALAMKVSDIDEKGALTRLKAWNERNEQPLTYMDVKRKVKSAYNKNGKQGPSAYFIRQLSGLPFSYTVWESAKSRSERVYSHMNEWKEDLLAHLRMRGGFIHGSQRNMAKEIRSSVGKREMPYSTFKKLVDQLIESGELFKLTSAGRSGGTTLSLTPMENTAETSAESFVEDATIEPSLNEPNSNTLKAPEAGGNSLDLEPSPSLPNNSFLPTSSTHSVLAPVPGNIPDFFVSQLFNRSVTDGRLLFAAWGRVQLAFKEFSIGYASLCRDPGHCELIKRAIGRAFEVKGREIVPGSTESDAFLRYLYGTIKGMYSQDRERQLIDFVCEIESMETDFELEIIARKLERDLSKNTAEDPELLQDKLSEIESEIAARTRRNSTSKMPSWLD